jgi:hypothetical protein
MREMTDNPHKLAADEYALLVSTRNIRRLIDGQLETVQIAAGRIHKPGVTIVRGTGTTVHLGTEQELRDWAAANGIEVK